MEVSWRERNPGLALKPAHRATEGLEMGSLQSFSTARARRLCGTALALVALTSCTNSTLKRGSGHAAPAPVAQICELETLRAIASGLSPRVLIKEIPNGPKLADGVSLVAATDKLPAYCQVTGSYETNRGTGKTA